MFSKIDKLIRQTNKKVTNKINKLNRIIDDQPKSVWLNINLAIKTKKDNNITAIIDKNEEKKILTAIFSKKIDKDELSQMIKDRDYIIEK